MNKRKIRTVTINPFVIDFKILEHDLHGGILQFEEFRNGTKIIVKVKITQSWKLKKVKQAINAMVDREIDIAENFAAAANATSD